MFRIAWMNSEGFKSHGDYALSFKQAREWLEHLSLTRKDITHWIECENSKNEQEL